MYICTYVYIYIYIAVAQRIVSAHTCSAYACRPSFSLTCVAQACRLVDSAAVLWVLLKFSLRLILAPLTEVFRESQNNHSQRRVRAALRGGAAFLLLRQLLPTREQRRARREGPASATHTGERRWRARLTATTTGETGPPRGCAALRRGRLLQRRLLRLLLLLPVLPLLLLLLPLQLLQLLLRQNRRNTSDASDTSLSCGRRRWAW